MSIEAARLFVSVGADTRQGEQGLKSFNDKMNNAARGLTMTGAALTAGVTLPLLAIGKAALDSAMDFEQNMNILQQVSGASADTMSDLSAEALRLGAVTSFSAGEAASGMLELAKAGMSTEDVLASIGGVMALAAAGGVSLAEAAGLVASTLNAFGLEASESARIADLLAGAANASAASISDLGAGMQQAGFAFDMANQPVENLATSLAILTNVGLTGSDAGTALKNAFMRMMNPTIEAAGVMDQLGISFYDAAGNMKALPEIIDVLNVATAGLTAQERDQALATIFLSDGMKAMIPLMDAGSEGFNEMLTSVTATGAATSVADARMRGLSGGIEYLKGSVDSFLIGAALPFLDTLGGLARGAGDLLTQFGALPEPIRNATLAFLGMAAALGPLLLVMGAVVGALASPLLPIALLIIGVAALSAAWIANVGGIQEITATAFDAVTLAVGQGVAALQNFIATATGVDLKALWGDTTQMATKLTGQLKAGLAMEVDWSQLQVNAEGMVSRAGERLSAIDWTTMAVNFGGLLATAAGKITEQAAAFFGADNLIGRTISSITGVLDTLKTTFEGASFDAPLDLFNRTVTGVVSIMGLIGGVKTDVATTAIDSIYSLLNAALTFGTSLIAGADPALLAKAATGFVQGYANAIVAVFGDEKQLANLGSTVGIFGTTLITKLGDTFADPKFGTDVGAAVGTATAAFIAGATAFVAGAMGEVSKVNWADFQSDVDTFAKGFVSGAVTGLKTVEWGEVGISIRDSIVDAIILQFSGKTILDLLPGPLGGIGGKVGELTGVPTFEESAGILERGFTFDTPPLVWADIIDPVDWAAIIPDFGFGAGLTGWGSFVERLEWPTIPPFNWEDFIDNINPFAGNNNSPNLDSGGSIGGQAEASSAGSTRFAMAGAGREKIILHVHVASIANDMDVHTSALRLAKEFQRRVR